MNLLGAAPASKDGPGTLRAAAGACSLTPWRRAILCGRRVVAAYGLEDVPPLGQVRVGRTMVLVLPHPSGRCRWWNDPRNRAAAAAALDTFMPHRG